MGREKAMRGDDQDTLFGAAVVGGGPAGATAAADMARRPDQALRRRYAAEARP